MRNAAVSIPEPLCTRIDRLARCTRRSRRAVVRAALEEYAARHEPAAITDAYNRVVDSLGDQRDPFLQAAVNAVLRSVEWTDDPEEEHRS